MSIPFGIALTVIAYGIGLRIKNRVKHDLANPLMIAVILIVITLVIIDKPYSFYKQGGDYIQFFLAPLTVVLGVTLYRQRSIIKADFLPILLGITASIFTSLLSIIFLGNLLGLPSWNIITLIPKSITSPMAISLRAMIGGDFTLLIVMIQLTGITGAIFAPYMVKLFPWLDKAAVGVGIGASAHAIGTSKALEMGDVEGATSTTAIGLAGILTVLLVPFLIHFLEAIGFLY